MARRTNRLQHFTAAWINGIAASETREDWYDEACPGLTLRVSPSGGKVFYWSGRVGTRQTRMKLGTFPALSIAAARDEAKRISGETAAGEFPKLKSRAMRDEVTFGQLHEWYIENYAKPHKRSWRRNQRTFEIHLSHWANRQVSTITPVMVNALHVEIAEKAGKFAANAVINLIRNEYRRGQKLGYIKTPDPSSAVVRFQANERERFLTPDEIPLFLAALDQLTPTARDVLKLCLFTGARRSNVCAMRWDEINLDTRVWSIPASKSKSKRPMSIVLPQPALEVLKQRKESAHSQWVFPSHSSKGHFTDPTRAMAAAIQKAGIKGVRPHDLRRTLGSWMAAAGASLLVIGKALGQESQKSTAIYSRMNLKPIMDAVEFASMAIVTTPDKKTEK